MRKASVLDELLGVMRKLRDPNEGCPWDLRQTMQSIVPHTLEEAYELSAAIEQSNQPEILSELGDLLFQILFYAQIAKEEGWGDFEAVCNTLHEKLLYRHPHVFGDVKVAHHVEQSQLWEKLKSQTRKQESLLDDIPRNLPSLSYSQKVQKRAASVGFIWPDVEGVLLKIEEEIAEIRAVYQHSQQKAQEELGDLLFAVSNLALWFESDAEQLLRLGTDKFIKRFTLVERFMKADKLKWDDCDLDTLQKYWIRAKEFTVEITSVDAN